MSKDRKPSDQFGAPTDVPTEPIARGRLDGIPFESPVQPAQLQLDDEFTFKCYPGISCFNECCKSIDIQLLPYDILRLKQRMDMTSHEFVARHTVPFEMDFHGMPGLKLMTKPGTGECVFLAEEGCTVYEDRPIACRYYALGSMGVLKKDAKGAVISTENRYFLVKEPHCKGHDEDRKLTVREYREEQGCEPYDVMNLEWRDIVIRKRSTGATVGKPSERSMQLFDMCSYDVDSFREFIQSDSFARVFDLDADTRATLEHDDSALLNFSMRFLKQVLFGEMTIALKEGAAERRVEERKGEWEKRIEAEARKIEARDERYELPDKGR